LDDQNLWSRLGRLHEDRQRRLGLVVRDQCPAIGVRNAG
jgi:hypothetical protein